MMNFKKQFSFITFFLVSIGYLNFAFAQLNLNLVSQEIRTKVEQSYNYVLQREPTYFESDDLLINLANTFNKGFRLERRDGTLYLTEQVVPLIKKIQFTGLNLISSREALQIMEISENDIFNLDSLIDASQKLQDYYKKQSYLNNVIDIDYPLDESGHHFLTFHIKEGKPTLIRRIQIENANTELEALLKSTFNNKIKEPLRENVLAELSKDMREVLAKNGYYQTSLNSPKITLNSAETEATLIYVFDSINKYDFEFIGNKKFTTSRLSETLELDGYYSSAPNIALELEGKLKNFYLSKGYAKVDIQTQTTEGSSPNKLNVKFEIYEDQVIRIKKINFTGRWSKDEAYYTKLFNEFAPEIIQDKILSKNDLDIAVKNFIVQLQNAGYLTVKINSTKTVYDKENPSQVTININFDEGPLTLIKDIAFTGNSSFQPSELLAKLKVGSPGSPLHVNLLEQAVLDLRSHYYDNGYIEMLILNEKDLVRYNENNTEATVQFSIFEGPKVRVANIVLEGNRLTHDKVILAEIELKVGDLVTPAKIEESVARLQRTGFFSQIEMRTLEEKSMISDRTLLVRVRERDPGVFTIGVGANNEYGFTVHGYTGVSYRNIGGWGRAISTRVEGNYNVTDYKYLETKATVAFVEPYLFESRTSFLFNFTRSNEISDFDRRKITQLNSTFFSLEQVFTSHVTARYDILGVSTYVDQGFNTDEIPRTDSVIASTGPTLTLDYRDNSFNPTKGFFSKFNFELSTENLGSSKVDEFFRATGNVTHYLLVYPKKSWIWANYMGGGYLTDIRQRGYGVPYDKKGFLLGSRSTIRGFESSEAFPRNKDIGDEYKLTSTSSFELFKSELRVPVYKEFGMALFYDGGRVVIQGLRNDRFSSEWRHSAGFGARYNTPIGPVNADLGFKLNQKNDESPWAFHLSIGSF